MELNGRNSCTGNSRHIDIRYFWVKNQIDNKIIRVEYMPTHLMLADYFTKPMQGEKFRELRSFVMGWRPLRQLLNQKDKPATQTVKKVTFAEGV